MAAFFSPTLSRSDALSDGTHRQFGRWYRSQPTAAPPRVPRLAAIPLIGPLPRRPVFYSENGKQNSRCVRIRRPAMAQ